MEHIKTRVKVAPVSKCIVDSDGDIVAVCQDVYALVELGLVINERDDLIAQHDALVAACVVSRQLLADIVKYYDVILQDVGMDAMVRRVEQATRAALALVKGADADQD